MHLIGCKHHNYAWKLLLFDHASMVNKHDTAMRYTAFKHNRIEMHFECIYILHIDIIRISDTNHP